MKTFGTLRRDSYFSPEAVLQEATALNAAIKLLGRARFEAGKDIDSTAGAAWNSFVHRWKNFYSSMLPPFGLHIPGTSDWIFRSLNSTRDNLLNFEDEYSIFHGATEVTTPGSTTLIPAPVADTARNEDSVSHALNETVDAAKKAVTGIAAPLAAILGVAILGGIGYTLWKGHKHGK